MSTMPGIILHLVRQSFGCRVWKGMLRTNGRALFWTNGRQTTSSLPALARLQEVACMPVRVTLALEECIMPDQAGPLVPMGIMQEGGCRPSMEERASS